MIRAALARRAERRAAAQARADRLAFIDARIRDLEAQESVLIARRDAALDRHAAALARHADVSDAYAAARVAADAVFRHEPPCDLTGCASAHPQEHRR